MAKTKTASKRKRRRVAVFATFILARLEILVLLNNAILVKRSLAKLYL